MVGVTICLILAFFFSLVPDFTIGCRGVCGRVRATGHICLFLIPRMCTFPIFDMSGRNDQCRLCRVLFKDMNETRMLCLTVVACTSGNLVIQEQHGFSLKKIG